MTKEEKRKNPRLRGMGRLYRQKGCSRWTIQYYARGHRIREATGTADKNEAIAKLKARLGEVANGEFAGLQRVTVGELAESYFEAQKINGAKRVEQKLRRWQNHMSSFFGRCRASTLSTDMVRSYIRERKNEGAKNATVNRELAALKRLLNAARQDSPPKIRTVPYIPMLKENNVRKGFVNDADFSKLSERASELWLRSFLELGFTYGWRKSELLSLRVRQVNLDQRTIRLDPGTTKNDEGREVAMTEKVFELLSAAINGKGADDFVLSRQSRNVSRPIKDFRGAWYNLCVGAGLGSFACRACGKSMGSQKCECGGRSRTYRGLIPHDLRRSAAKALRAAGVPESVVMSMGGWKTAAMFRRYAIVSHADQRAAVELLQHARNTNCHKSDMIGEKRSKLHEGTQDESIN